MSLFISRAYTAFNQRFFLNKTYTENGELTLQSCDLVSLINIITIYYYLTQMLFANYINYKLNSLV